MKHRSIQDSSSQELMKRGAPNSISAAWTGRATGRGRPGRALGQAFGVASSLLAGLFLVSSSACHLEPERPELKGEVTEVSFQLPALNQLLHVRIFTPEGFDKEDDDPLPVAYVLGDGDYFDVASEYASGLDQPLLVVGLGYGRDERHKYPACGTDEYRDFTPQPGTTHNTECAGGKADGFFMFLRDTVLPAVDAEIGADSSRRTLIGHDLGALFIAHTAFAHGTTPNFPFAVMVAGDTPLGFDDGVILRREERLFTQDVTPPLPVALRMIHGELSDPAHYTYFQEFDTRLSFNRSYDQFNYGSEIIEDADSWDMRYITMERGVMVARGI